MWCITRLLLCLALCGAGAAKAEEAVIDPHWVIDQTLTSTGKAFYRSFYTGWQEQVLAKEVTVVVTERPSARWGNIILVEFDHQLLYQGVLSNTRRWNIEDIAQQAVPAATARLIEIVLLSQYEQDLGKDEL